MEDIGLIHIHIHRIVMLQGGRINVILNGGNIVVDEKLLAAHIPGKAPNPVVNGDDIRVKAADQVIEGVQRRNGAAGGHVDIHPEGRDCIVRVILRKGVDCHMALVQVRMHRSALPVTQITGFIDHFRIQFLFSDQHIHRCALGLIILLGNIQYTGTDHLRHITENIGQTLGIVLLIDICNIVLLLPGAFGIAHIINIKTQGFCQVIEAIQGYFILHGGHSLSCILKSSTFRIIQRFFSAVSVCHIIGQHHRFIIPYSENSL